MNERIKKLIEHCTVVYIPEGSVHDELTFDCKLFAELIVQECANICFSEAQGHNMDFGEHCGVVIKEHFGVK